MSTKKNDSCIYAIQITVPVVVYSHSGSQQIAMRHALDLIDGGIRNGATCIDVRAIKNVKDLPASWDGTCLPYGDVPNALSNCTIQGFIDLADKTALDARLKEARVARLAVEKAKALEQSLNDNEKALSAMGYVYDSSVKDYVLRK